MQMNRVARQLRSHIRESCFLICVGEKIIVVSMEQEAEFLTGKLLVAMPGMGDPRFDKAVIFMCAHSSDGAMGLVVNKPAPELQLTDLLEQLEINTDAKVKPGTDIYVGGPVEHGRGFVLHSSDYELPDSTMTVTDRIGMTATVDVLRDIAEGVGPRKTLLALGYSGWAPGQLERELQANGWLICDADETILFANKPDTRWKATMDKLGIDPRVLSAEGGRA